MTKNVTYSDYCVNKSAGENPIPSDALIELAKKFNVKTDYLLGLVHSTGEEGKEEG